MKNTSINFVTVVTTFIAITLFVFSGSISKIESVIQYAGDQLAAVILAHNPKTIAEIQSDYNSISPNLATPSANQTKVRILLMPGHEPNFGGAEFGTTNTLKEREMNVELADDLNQFLQNNSHYQITVARDNNAWNPIFANYFKNDWQDIIDWMNASKAEESHLIAIGSTTQSVSSVYHNTTPIDGAIRLYGITKWANENNIDIEIHIHFNDNRGHGSDTPGKYSGFAVYVPAAQYDNSTTTKAIAETVFKRLAKYNPVSDLPGESVGVVDDPELIAIGSNNTADAASMLIEYSYIYEPQLLDAQTRSMAIKDLAYQTYLGLQDFFDPQNDSVASSLSKSYDTTVLPYVWNATFSPKNADPKDVFALQTALISDGDYPPSGKTLNDCPRTGKIGDCTITALNTFQQKYNITDENGTVGDKTLEILNKMF